MADDNADDGTVEQLTNIRFRRCSGAGVDEMRRLGMYHCLFMWYVDSVETYLSYTPVYSIYAHFACGLKPVATHYDDQHQQSSHNSTIRECWAMNTLKKTAE